MDINLDGVTFIEDNLECAGFLLLKCLTNRLLSTVDKIIMFCSETPESLMKHKLDEAKISLQRISFQNTEKLNFSCLKRVEEESSNGQQLAVVFDSASPWLLCDDFDSFACLVNKLHWIKSTGVPILVLIHQELLSEEIIRNRLQFVTNNWLRLEADGEAVLCHSRRTSGKTKIVHNTYIVDFDPALATCKFSLRKSRANTKAKIAPSEATVVSENASAHITPFNLSLSERERKAKESVHLPFMEAQSKEGLVSLKSKAKFGGQIIYSPDEGDDLDDSDPDDDLNI